MKKAAKKAAKKTPRRIAVKAPRTAPVDLVDDVPPIEPQAQERAILGKTTGIRLGRNPDYVYGSLDGQLIPIFCGRKWSAKLVGKPIEFETADRNGVPYYSLVK